MTAAISPIDLGIIGAYFAVVALIGIAVGLRTKTGEDLFLGGRSLTWGVIGCSLFASNISSTTLIGLTGSAYTTGIAVSNYEWLSGVPLILMAAVFVPIYLNARITTVPEYLELRYDRRSRRIFSLITIAISIVVDTAGGLYAGAVVLKVFFPGIVLWQASLALAVFAGFYTAFGGLKAVAYTDTLQAMILILGCGLLTATLYSELDFSWSALTAALPEGHLSVIRPWDDPTLPWPGTLVGVPLLGFWYWVTNQYVAQRVLAAKSLHHARWGVMLGGFLKVIPLFIMVLPGAMALSVMPGIRHPDQVFPTLVAQLLPAGAVGIVLAGLISAIMSSVDSTLNSAATLIVVDFIKPSRAALAPREVAKYGRIATLVLMTLAAIWAPMIGHFGGLWSYLQMVFSIVVPPIATVFLLGVFSRRGGGSSACATLLIGFALGVLVFALTQAGLWRLHFSVNVGAMFLVSCAVYGLASYRQPATAPGRDIERLVYSPGLGAAPRSLKWFQDYRVHALVLALIMAAILLGFW